MIPCSAPTDTAGVSWEAGFPYVSRSPRREGSPRAERLLLYTGSPIVGGVDRLLQAVEQDFAGCDLSWSYEEMDPDVFGEELETSAYSTVDRIAAVVLTARKPGV